MNREHFREYCEYSLWLSTLRFGMEECEESFATAKWHKMKNAMPWESDDTGWKRRNIFGLLSVKY